MTASRRKTPLSWLTRLVPLLGMVGALGACGLAGQGEEPPCASSNATPPGVDGGLSCGQAWTFNPGGEGEPRGRFAVKVVQYLHLSSAGIVEADAMASAIGWAEFSPEPGQTGQTTGRMDLKMCHLEVPQVHIPGQAEPSALELAPGALSYVPPPGTGFSVTGYETCDGFLTDPNVIVVAARLVDVMDDPLPSDLSTQSCTSATDTRCVFDQDQDGKPAVTFLAHNFPALNVDEVYATLRSWVVMDGLVASPDLILGTARFGMEISVVSCRIEPLGGGPVRRCTSDEADVIASITPVVTQSPDVDSTFVAVRVDPTTGCEDIIEQADRLFGR